MKICRKVVSINRRTIGVVRAPCAHYRLRPSETALGRARLLCRSLDAPLTENDTLKSLRSLVHMTIVTPVIGRN
jgi:hypothetical protein